MASAIVALGLVVIVVSAVVGTSAGWLPGAVLVLLALVARAVVGPVLDTTLHRVRRRTLERTRTAVARLIEDAPPSAGPEHGELTGYLRARLVGGRRGPGLAIVTGVDRDHLKAIAESAVAALRPSVQAIVPPGDSPDDVRAFAAWLVDGADEERLPLNHDRSAATLFLLGELERYSHTDLEPSHFERWRDRAHPRLALATALRRSGAAAAGSSWDNDLFGAAHVIPILEGADIGGRSPA